MAGLFSSTTLEQVRAANDIVDVVSAVLPLKRAGANFVALCPFHREKTPSFHVNPQRQTFHCFGCHKGGNVFQFIQEYENLTFPEAVRRLADRAKIPLEFEHGAGQVELRSRKDALLQIHEQIATRWQAALASDAAAQIARAYLARRGVSAEAVQLFRLGYAPEAWDDTVNWAKAKGYELPLVEQAGLIIRKEGDSRYYDRFRARLMFPICDEQGRVIAFSGRVLAGDEKTAKYVNSPETPIFTKGKVFYGLDKSKRSLLEAQFAVICEGQLDLIACYMAGVRNIVAPQGTAFTADHARILKRYVDEVVLCFDSDSAGQAAAVRVLDSLLASGLAIRVATVPAPHDPDSFIKAQGGPAFASLIERAEGFFDYYLNLLCASHDLHSDKGQLAISRAMAEALHKTGSSILLDRYAQKTALRLGLAPDATRQAWKQTARVARDEPRSESAAPKPETAPPPSQPELWLLRILLLEDELTGWIAAHLDPNWLQHPRVRQIVDLRLNAPFHDQETGPAALLSQVEDEPVRRLITEALAWNQPILHPRQQLSDILVRLRNQAIDRELALVVQRASDPALDNAQSSALLGRIQELKRAKAQPLAEKAGDS
jgi:DNA primase